MDLLLKFAGDGKDEGVVGEWVVVLGAEEGVGLSFEEILDLAPDERNDGRCVGHRVMRRNKSCVVMRMWKAEATVVCVNRVN